MHAVVVDHSKAMRVILRRVLRECGYEDVVEAGNGRDSLDALAAIVASDPAPALALIDEDVEFVTAVRTDPAYADIALVMITAETAEHGIGATLDAGADAYVTRPFTKQALVEELERLGISRVVQSASS